MPPDYCIQETHAWDQFSLLMSKVGGISPWFAFLLILGNIPGFCLGLMSIIFIRDDNDLMVICKIPELGQVSWPLPEIHNITSDRRNDCKYRNYDYSLLSTMQFTEASQYVNKLERKPPFVDCKTYSAFGKTHSTIFTEFKLVCNRWAYYFTDSLGSCLADITAGLFIVPLADILGRKRLISWGIVFFFSGAIFVAFTLSDIALAIGWFFLCIGYRLMRLATDIIILEIANGKLRKAFCFLTYIGLPLGCILAQLYNNVQLYWRLIFLVVSTSLLFLPFLEWYFPESPRWLMSKNRKTKAFAILKSLKQPEVQEELLQRYRNFDRSYLRSLNDHFRQMRLSIFSANFAWVSLLFVVMRMTTLDTFEWKIMDRLKVHEELFTFGLFIDEICILLLAAPFFVIVKRTKLIATPFLLLAGLLYAICCLTHSKDKQGFTVAFLLANIFTFFSLLCSSLHLLEASPTSHRATTGGLVISAGTGIAKLMLIFCIKYLKMNQMCSLLLAACVASASFPLFLGRLPVGDLQETEISSTR